MAKYLGRCVALDENGKRCLKRATIHENYHGNHEFYGYFTEPKGRTWIVAAFCEAHRSAPEKKARRAK